jgi:Ca2+-binding EF-hand superfamily protein
MNKVNTHKEDLHRRYDYGAYTSFKTVDRLNDGYLTLENLSKFTKYHSYYYTDRDILAIIRRIDTDGDAKISYAEFSDFLRLQKPLDIEYTLNTRSMSE